MKEIWNNEVGYVFDKLSQNDVWHAIIQLKEESDRERWLYIFDHMMKLGLKHVLIVQPKEGQHYQVFSEEMKNLE